MSPRLSHPRLVPARSNDTDKNAPSSVGTLADRIAVLEVRNRRLRMAIWSTALASLLLCVMCIRSSSIPPVSAEATHTAHDTATQLTRTQAVEIVDSAGTKRLAAVAKETGAPGVIAYKSTGAARMMLADTGLYLARGKRVSLILTYGEMSGLKLFDSDDQLRIGVVVLDTDRPAVFVRNEDGKVIWVAPK